MKPLAYEPVSKLITILVQPRGVKLDSLQGLTYCTLGAGDWMVNEESLYIIPHFHRCES